MKNEKATATEKALAGLALLWALLIGFIVVGLICGCASKARHVDLAGMYATEAGMLAIGSIEIQSTPDGGEAALVRYEDSEPWIGDEKEHRISITLTGTNAVNKAGEIVRAICEAFVSVAASTNSPTPPLIHSPTNSPPKGD